MNILLQIIRWFTGILFIISGLIKLNDPVGTQIKMEEYFEVFADSFTPLFHHLVPAALVIGLAMCILEVVLGVALLLAWRIRVTLGALLGLIIFFTFLTFYSAYFNKVTDCGCFGDAIKLTPWQSFTKDVVLTILIMLLYTQRHRFSPVLPDRKGTWAVAGTTVASLVVGLVAIWHLPYIDFRPYGVGENIVANRQLPPGGKPSIYEVRYQLHNTNTNQDLTVTDKEYMQREELWANGWEVKSTEGPILIQQGDKPRITDLSLRDDDGNDRTQDLLTGTKLVVIIRSGDLEKVERYKSMAQLLHQAEDRKLAQPLILASVDRTALEAIRHEAQLAAPYLYVDGTVAKTIMRSDPGTWLLKDGVVLGKWHYNDTPSIEEVEGLVR